MSLKRSHNEFTIDESNGESSQILLKSTPIEDRDSTFVGLFSPSLAPKALQAYLDFKSASHRIVAWRKPSAQRSLAPVKGSQSMSNTLYVTGSDDDGEKYAGKKLEKVLVDMDVAGSLVVARWYGGIMLGPVRFTHMETVARDAIVRWKAHQSRTSGTSMKKQKADDEIPRDPEAEAREKNGLAKQLSERDNSITVLRQLLTEKSSQNANESEKSKQSQPTSSQTGPDYESMSIERLQQLSKARDATISWILKQIDAAEAKQVTKSEQIA